jgi:hypothetical protein
MTRKFPSSTVDHSLASKYLTKASRFKTAENMAQLSDEFSALQKWIKANAIAVRTVDALDEDFSDLEPLANLVANVRVVQLGEPSHGAGTSFAAKVRLIKFLHQRMGFDVLVWESGFYDLERTEAGLRAGDNAVLSAQRGILKIWSASEQCRPLFEYAKESHAGPIGLIRNRAPPPDPMRAAPNTDRASRSLDRLHHHDPMTTVISVRFTALKSPCDGACYPGNRIVRREQVYPWTRQM